MKVYRMNPNCSEIVVYLGNLTRGDPIEDVQAEIKEILDKTNLKLAVETHFYGGKDSPRNYRRDIALDNLREGGDREVSSDIMPRVGERGEIVRDLEIEGFDLVVLYLPGNDPADKYSNNSASITTSGFGPATVLMISDCDRNQFAVIAEAIRAMGYTWYPHDGGHSDGFVDWCNTNGYSDVAERLG